MADDDPLVYAKSSAHAGRLMPPLVAKTCPRLVVAVGGAHHDGGMLHWFEQLAAGLGATAIGAYTVVPRINARMAEVAHAHEVRRTFRFKLTSITGLCQRLRLMTVPDEASPEYAARLEVERERWLAQLDEHTAWLMDNTEWFALGYLRAGGIRDLAADYAFAVRITFISEREAAEKFAVIEQLTTRAHVIFAASRLAPGFSAAFKAARSALRQQINEISGAPSASLAATTGGEIPTQSAPVPRDP
jgi:hypothetical protein